MKTFSGDSNHNDELRAHAVQLLTEMDIAEKKVAPVLLGILKDNRGENNFREKVFKAAAAIDLQMFDDV